MYWLRFRGRLVPIRAEETLIGRGTRCTILVDEQRVSREHAKLILKDGTLRILDLGSSNGTLVNGVRIAGAQPLDRGDLVGIGSEILEVEHSRDGDDDVSPSSRSTGSLASVVRALRTSAPGDGDVDKTIPHTNALDLIEMLVTRATSSGRHESVVPILRRAIDQFADRPDRTTSDSKRVLEIIDKMARWFPDGSLDSWRHTVTARLGSPR